MRRVGHLQRRVEGGEHGALSRAAAVVLPFLRANTLISTRGGMRKGGATKFWEPNFRFPSGRAGGREGGGTHRDGVRWGRLGSCSRGCPSGEDDIFSYDTSGHENQTKTSWFFSPLRSPNYTVMALGCRRGGGKSGGSIVVSPMGMGCTKELLP